MSEEKKTIKTRHGELTLEQLAEAQPGMARLMKEVGERYGILFYAAKGGNWMLAQHELKQVIALFKVASMLRPKYSQDLASFTREYFDPLADSIKAHDWERFVEIFHHGVDAGNVYHEKYGYDFIRYVLSKTPPANYDLSYSKTGDSSD